MQRPDWTLTKLRTPESPRSSSWVIKSVFNVAHAGAAVAFQRCAEEAEIGHGLDQFAGKAAGAVALFDDGDEIVFDELARGVANQAFFFGKE